VHGDEGGLFEEGRSGGEGEVEGEVLLAGGGLEEGSHLVVGGIGVVVERASPAVLESVEVDAGGLREGGAEVVNSLNVADAVGGGEAAEDSGAADFFFGGAELFLDLHGAELAWKEEGGGGGRRGEGVRGGKGRLNQGF